MNCMYTTAFPNQTITEEKRRPGPAQGKAVIRSGTLRGVWRRNGTEAPRFHRSGPSDTFHGNSSLPRRLTVRNPEGSFSYAGCR